VAVGTGTALQVGRSRFRFPLVSLEFFIDMILPTALGLTHPVTEMSQGGQCIGLTTLRPSCAECLESGSLNLLEPSGAV
jgi:hypothetical protein